MVTTTNQACRKNGYQKVTFEHKLFVIDQINNGQISVYFAFNKYNISFPKKELEILGKTVID